MKDRQCSKEKDERKDKESKQEIEFITFVGCEKCMSLWYCVIGNAQQFK